MGTDDVAGADQSEQLSPLGPASVRVFGFSNNIFGLGILLSSITNRAAFPIFAPQIIVAMGTEFAEKAVVLIGMTAAGICMSGQQPLINLPLVNDMVFTNLAGMVVWSASFLSIALVPVGMGALGRAYGVLAAAVAKGVFVTCAVMLTQRRNGNDI